METNYRFPVALQKITTLRPIGGGHDLIPGRKAVVRQDTGDVLGIISDKYQLLPHAKVVEGFRTALSGQKYEEKIQVPGKGQNLFATYKLGDVQLAVKKGDLVSLQFVVKNSYDGYSSLQIALGAFRMVCSNGLIIGKQFFSFSIRHMGGLTKELRLTETLEKLANQFSESLPILQEMTRTRIDKRLDTIELFDPKRVEMPKYLVEQAEQNFEKEGNTVWDYYNAYTAALTHSMKKESPNAQLIYGQKAWANARKLIR